MFQNDNERLDLIELLDLIEEKVGEPACKQWPDGFHPEGGEATGLQMLACRSCPVKLECAEFAFKWNQQGIWGGTTPTDRNQLKRRLGLVRTYNKRS